MDGYTKAFLTVIAGALIAPVIQNSVRPATADAPPCRKVRNSCHFTSTSDDPLALVKLPRSAFSTLSFTTG